MSTFVENNFETTKINGEDYIILVGNFKGIPYGPYPIRFDDALEYEKMTNKVYDEVNPETFQKIFIYSLLYDSESKN